MNKKILGFSILALFAATNFQAQAAEKKTGDLSLVFNVISFNSDGALSNDKQELMSGNDESSILSRGMGFGLKKHFNESVELEGGLKEIGNRNGLGYYADLAFKQKLYAFNGVSLYAGGLAGYRGQFSGNHDELNSFKGALLAGVSVNEFDLRLSYYPTGEYAYKNQTQQVQQIGVGGGFENSKSESWKSDETLSISASYRF